jgi:hypothetical protein
MSELSDLRRERDRLERQIDALHRKHDDAQRVARHCVNQLSQVEGDLQELTIRINRHKP